MRTKMSNTLAQGGALWPSPSLCALAFVMGVYFGAWWRFPLFMLALSGVAAMMFAACVMGARPVRGGE